jgi:hypothetical protein
MNSTSIFYLLFFLLVIFLSLYVLGVFHNLKKNISINQSDSNNKFIRNLVIGFVVSFTIIILVNNKTNSYSNSAPIPELKKTQIETKPSLSECLRLYGNSPDMTPWELAQAECLLQQNDYKTACDCMVLLAK